jgi:phage terminase large subunit
MIRLHPVYQSIVEAPEDVRYFIITGGRGSGKSFAVNTILTLLTFERGHRVLFTRYTMTSAERSIIPEFIDKINLIGKPELFDVQQKEVLNRYSGSSILFAGIKTSSGNQTAALKSLHGITTWVLDEAEELTDEATFDTIDLSVRTKGRHNRVILVLNPKTKEHWIYKRFYEGAGVPDGFTGIKGDTMYIHTTFEINRHHLNESYLLGLEKMRAQRPEKYKHQVLGMWADKAEGVILSNWSLGDFPPDVQPIYGQDFGFSVDPTTLVAVHVDKDRRKLYVKEMYGQAGLSTSQVYTLNNAHAGKGLIIADNAEPRLIDELKARGLNIVKCVKTSVVDGIAQLLDFDIVVDPLSTEIVKEFNNYVWLERKSQTPIDAHNHRIDAIRYVVSYVLENPNKGRYVVV